MSDLLSRITINSKQSGTNCIIIWLDTHLKNIIYLSAIAIIYRWDSEVRRLTIFYPPRNIFYIKDGLKLLQSWA